MNILDNRKAEYEETLKGINSEGIEEYHFDKDNPNLIYIAYTEDKWEERLSTSNVYLDVEENEIHFNYYNGVLNFNFSFEATKEILKDFLEQEFECLISLWNFVDYEEIDETKLEKYTQKYVEHQVTLSDIETELTNEICGFIDVKISKKYLDFP